MTYYNETPDFKHSNIVKSNLIERIVTISCKSNTVIIYIQYAIFAQRNSNCSFMLDCPPVRTSDKCPLDAIPTQENFQFKQVRL